MPERLIGWAERGWGKLLLLAFFSLLFRDIYSASEVYGRNHWPPIMLAITLCSLAGSYRRHVLAITTLLLLVLAPDWYPSVWLSKMQDREGIAGEPLGFLRPLALLAVFACSAALVAWRRRFPNGLLGRWPVLSLIVFYFTLLAFASCLTGWLRLLIFSLLWSLSAYLWYLAYALRDASAPQRPPVWQELGSFHPYFAGTWIPIGLGAANLRQREVKSPRQLAVCQLKGLKLLGCCWLMFQLEHALVAWREQLELPAFQTLLHQHLAGAAFYPRSLCWASMLYSFFEGMVGAFALGNLLVACARMGGFQLLQQVYKPLAARSVNDYWNRISYYYKQVIVELFFYPCFLSFGKGYPRLRQALAIFVAAGLGNFVYHFRSVLPWAARLGLAQTLWGMRTYACYCLILSSGLLISQLRAARRPAVPDPVQRILILTRIILFFSILSLFDDLYTADSPMTRVNFLFYMCGGPHSML